MLVTWEITHINSHQHGCLNTSWTKMAAVDMLTWSGDSPQDLNPTPHTHTQRKKKDCRQLRNGKNAPIETYTQNNIIQTEEIIFSNGHLHKYVYVHTIIINGKEKRGHDFIREQGRVYKKLEGRKRIGEIL